MDSELLAVLECMWQSSIRNFKNHAYYIASLHARKLASYIHYSIALQRLRKGGVGLYLPIRHCYLLHFDDLYQSYTWPLSCVHEQGAQWACIMH